MLFFSGRALHLAHNARVASRLTFEFSCGAVLARLAATKTALSASERLNRGALAPSAFSRMLAGF